MLKNDLLSRENFMGSSITKQRKTSFTSSIPIVPDLNIFTEGPGTGKYSGVNFFTLNTKGFTIPKAGRPLSKNDFTKTPGHAYFPSNEKITGHYLSSDQSEKFFEKKQRRTSFSSNILVPDLNVFTEGPGTGKYAFRQIIGKHLIESNIENQPQFTIPKSARSLTQLNNMKTPGPGHYTVFSIKEKIPGHYSFSKRDYKQSDAETPGVGEYSPEKSLDSLKKSTPSARIPTARRFSNNLF